MKNCRTVKNLLIKNDLVQGTRIYFDGKCYSSKRFKNGEYEFELLNDILASDYFNYANDETISLSFEGELFEILNYEPQDSIFMKKFEKIFEDNNCYYEFGNSWNLTVYYNEEEK